MWTFRACVSHVVALLDLHGDRNTKHPDVHITTTHVQFINGNDRNPLNAEHSGISCTDAVQCELMYSLIRRRADASASIQNIVVQRRSYK